MTYERRTDPATGEPVADETRVVERETYVEHDRAQDPGYVPPAQPAASPQVNVNAADRGTTYVDEGPGPMYYVRRVVSLLFGILAVLIGLRILLLLLVANQQNSLVDFVYDITEPFVLESQQVRVCFGVGAVGTSRTRTYSYHTHTHTHTKDKTAHCEWSSYSRDYDGHGAKI